MKDNMLEAPLILYNENLGHILVKSSLSKGDLQKCDIALSPGLSSFPGGHQRGFPDPFTTKAGRRSTCKNPCA